MYFVQQTLAALTSEVALTYRNKTWFGLTPPASLPPLSATLCRVYYTNVGVAAPPPGRRRAVVRGGSCIGGSTVSSARSLCHRVRRYPRGLDDDCGRGWRRRPATVARRRSPSLLPSSILKQNLYSIRAEMMRKESPWLGLRIVYLSLGNGRRIKANQASFFFFLFLCWPFQLLHSTEKIYCNTRVSVPGSM